jgi:hypothetical protein
MSEGGPYSTPYLVSSVRSRFLLSKRSRTSTIVIVAGLLLVGLDKFHRSLFLYRCVVAACLGKRPPGLFLGECEAGSEEVKGWQVRG